MAGLPVDVWETALATLDGVNVNCPTIPGYGVYGSAMLTIAARAILAERQRCADVARREAANHHGPFSSQPAYVTAHFIAEAIEAGA